MVNITLLRSLLKLDCFLVNIKSTRLIILSDLKVNDYIFNGGYSVILNFSITPLLN